MRKYIITYNAKTKCINCNTFHAYISADSEREARRKFNKHKPIPHSKIVAINELIGD